MIDRLGSILVNGVAVAVAFIFINGGPDNRSALSFGPLAGLAIGLLVVAQDNPFDLYKFARRFVAFVRRS